MFLKQPEKSFKKISKLFLTAVALCLIFLRQVFEAASAKSDAVRFAEVREKEAEAAIRNVLESIAAGRKNKSTATNPQADRTSSLTIVSDPFCGFLPDLDLLL